MLTTLVVCAVAFTASVLTFFSGFGLGTLLLPAFAIFYPIGIAVASTAIVHFLNGLLKLVLVGRAAHRETVLRFGIPAIAAAFLGAWVLVRLSAVPPIARYSVAGLEAVVSPARVVVGVLLLAVTVVEFSPRFAAATVPPKYLPIGGLLSGFFGGLSGMQGALRSVFLIRAGLSNEAYVGTGVVVASLVDVSRLGVYSRTLLDQRGQFDYPVLGAAVASAFLGAVLGNRLLPKLTVVGLRRVVAAMLAIVGFGLAAGLV
ncbi:MAG: TSUP family transporter [Gemmatimonadales bacterium]